MTKQTLIDVAEDLFTQHGYANTSLDSIVSRAAVTKGALYHHFAGKRAVFEACFERIEARASATINEATADLADPWEKARAGLRAFLAVVQEAPYRRIVVQDGPSVLGHERFREQEERSTYANVTDIVRSVFNAETWKLDEAMLDTYSRIFFGALNSAGGSVAVSEEPRMAAARVEAAIGFILAGFQALAAQGAELPDPADLLEATWPR